MKPPSVATLGALALFKPSDVLMVSLCHDVMGAWSKYSGKFDQMKSLKGIRWEGPYAIVQTMRTSKTKYAEYIMLGFGTRAPANPFQGTNWVGPFPAYPAKDLTCDGCSHDTSSSLCPVSEYIRKRHCQHLDPPAKHKMQSQICGCRCVWRGCHGGGRRGGRCRH